MNAGFAQIDITPSRPVPLCGFGARCNATFKAVDDPLRVSALAIGDGTITTVILSYDLLAIGIDITNRIEDRLRDLDGSIEWVLCATHTHSAPAAIRLNGCGEEDDDYQELLVSSSFDVASKAIADARPCSMRVATRDLTGSNHNRRQVLADGRVSMSEEPAGDVVKRGAELPEMTLVRFDDEEGHGIGCIASWACHPCTVCGPNVTADFPGELCKRLTESFNVPVMFLQGACGNINPSFKEMTRQEMLANVDGMMRPLSDIKWSEPRTEERIVFESATINLAYDRAFTSEELTLMRKGMSLIAETGDGSDEMMIILGDILNVGPGAKPEQRMAKHIAGILRDWSEDVLDRDADETCDLGVSVLRMGQVALCFIAAEPFAETAIALQAGSPDDLVVTVGYASPMIGYLPTDEALVDGGYESEYAYRFYNHPASFMKGSEKMAVGALTRIIENTRGGR